MRHGSLFSGIGGFDLAAQWMGWANVFQVEIDPFCQKVLEKNFPNVKRYGDIKQFDGTKYRGTIDVLSGGFPCQPFSSAGKRKGTKDDRYLWPEMLRVIREVQPTYIVGENVYGLVNWSKGLVFEQVCSDLENEGYQVQPVILPACAVNAPHRRDRVWFVAYSQGNNDRRAEQELHKTDGRPVGELLSTSGGPSNGLCKEGITSNSRSDGYERRGLGEDRSTPAESESKGDQWQRVWSNTERTGAEANVANANAGRLEGSENETPWQFTADRNPWHQFPTQSPICRGNDGLSRRVDRIKSLGNAIVPQVAYEIFKAIESIR